jgi:hypothetical protein
MDRFRGCNGPRHTSTGGRRYSCYPDERKSYLCVHHTLWDLKFMYDLRLFRTLSCSRTHFQSITTDDDTLDMRANFLLEGEAQTHFAVEMHRPFRMSRPETEPYTAILPASTHILIHPWQRYRGNPMLPGLDWDYVDQVKNDDCA